MNYKVGKGLLNFTLYAIQLKFTQRIGSLIEIRYVPCVVQTRVVGSLQFCWIWTRPFETLALSGVNSTRLKWALDYYLLFSTTQPLSVFHFIVALLQCFISCMLCCVISPILRSQLALIFIPISSYIIKNQLRHTHWKWMKDNIDDRHSVGQMHAFKIHTWLCTQQWMAG